MAQAEAVRGESFARELEENIRAGRYARGVSARELETIVRDAAEEGRREGHDEGYARGQREGYEAGHAEGLAAGRKYLEEAAGRFAGLLESLHQPLLGQEQALREAMLEVTAQIARAVIRAELAIQPQSVARVIEEALAALPLGRAQRACLRQRRRPRAAGGLRRRRGGAGAAGRRDARARRLPRRGRGVAGRLSPVGATRRDPRTVPGPRRRPADAGT